VRSALFAFAALFALCWIVYRPALANGFIADDFINLHFVRSYRGSWWAFLDPRAMYSDPVTQTRYKPGYIYYFWLLDTLFRDHAFGYHLLSLALHVGVSFGVMLLSQRLFQNRTQSIAAAALFATSRLHVQMVVWVSANYRIASAGLALAAVLVLWANRRAVAIATSVALFAVSISMNPELVVVPAVLGALAIHQRAKPEMARRAWIAMAIDLVLVAAFVVANRISAARFPEMPMTPLPDPHRVLVFFANAFVPFALPLWFKLTCVAAIAIAALRIRERALVVPAIAMLSGAVLWGMLRGYPLAPRYLYFASAFGAVLLARVLGVGCDAVAVRLRFSASRDVALAVVCLPLVLSSIIAMRSFEFVLLDYLSLIGSRLMTVHREARAQGRRERVFIRPSSTLSDLDQEFFAEQIEFVSSPERATRIVDTEFERYRRALGPGLDEPYWDLPWFVER
jgi:hypothetical protein